MRLSSKGSGLKCVSEMVIRDRLEDNIQIFLIFFEIKIEFRIGYLIFHPESSTILQCV